MALIHTRHIKRQLQSIILLTSIVSLLLACIGFVTYDFVTYRRFMVRDLTTLADMVGANVQAALLFDDAKAAEDTLNSLRSRRSIMAAAVYKVPDKFFAGYTRLGEPKQFPELTQWESAHFEEGKLILFRPVFLDDRPVGIVFLQSDLQGLENRLRTFLSIALLLLVVSAFVAFVLSLRLQRGVSQPILELASTAEIISTGKDFSMRAKKYADNEIGLLADAFNQMLVQIEARDNALRESNESLATLNRDLEERVRQRTAELKESNDQMKVFAYSIAHDLRAPLRSMRGLSEVLLEDYTEKMDATAHDLLERILNSARHMDSLIQDLLLYSQISREELKFESVDLNRSIDTVLTLATDEIRVSGAEVIVDRPLPAVIGHPATLENVISNLVSNAIKYVAPGTPPRIHIHGEQKAGVARLWFEDNGIGIAPQYQQTIFGIFTRLHGKESYPGTGIGLAFVKKGIERMGGRVGVESSVGQGSRFWIEVPACQIQENVASSV